MSESAIVADRLVKEFGSFRAVDNLSFEVGRGEIFGFLGANGAGKSTTIRMLIGVLEPTAGRAVVGGHDVARQTDDLKRSIGYMSQKFSLYDDLTVRQNIRLFGGVHRLGRAELNERETWVMEMAGLTGREDDLTRTLSGGWKQRLALGCAIIHRPPIVFLDEPTSGVDPVSRRNFWSLIDDLASGGTTVLVTTHYLEEAEYCNRLGLIHAGRLIASGSPGELRTTAIRLPILEVTCDRTTTAFETIRSKDFVAEASMFGTAIHVMVHDEERGRAGITAALAAAGVKVERIEKIPPSLEDVFLHLLSEHESEADAVR
jgi:ABC-2 type transport system ATP-binding protein